jgi:hypothetical protein
MAKEIPSLLLFVKCKITRDESQKLLSYQLAFIRGMCYGFAPVLTGGDHGQSDKGC